MREQKEDAQAEKSAKQDNQNSLQIALIKKGIDKNKTK